MQNWSLISVGIYENLDNRDFLVYYWDYRVVAELVRSFELHEMTESLDDSQFVSN